MGPKVKNKAEGVHETQYVGNSMALRNWKIFLKVLSKRLRKLTIKTKQLWRLKFLSFVKVNN